MRVNKFFGTPTLLLSFFALEPILDTSFQVCLTSDWWGHDWCQSLGMQYIDYPTDLAGLNEFRRTLFDPAITTWFQAGTEEWFKIIQIIKVRRNSSLGTVFDGKRSPGRDDGGVESSHVCLENPRTPKGSKTTQSRVPIHLTKIAYAEGSTLVPDNVNKKVVDPHVPAPPEPNSKVVVSPPPIFGNYNWRTPLVHWKVSNI